MMLKILAHCTLLEVLSQPPRPCQHHHTTLDCASTPALQDLTPLGRAPQPAQRRLRLDALGRCRGEALLRAVPVAAAELAGPDPPLVRVSPVVVVVVFVWVGLVCMMVPGFDGWLSLVVVGRAGGGGERAHWCEDKDEGGESHYEM